MNVKKWLYLIVFFFLFYEGVLYLNDRMDEEFFSGYYQEIAEVDSEDDGPSLWEKISIFFEELFEDKEKEEKFIYK